MASSTTALRTAAPRLSRLFAGNSGQITGDAALRAAASVYLNFCSLTRNIDPELLGRLAATRYLRFQELRTNTATLRRWGLNGRHEAVPTRDISAAWASDLLRPTDMAVVQPTSSNDDVPEWYTHQQNRLLQSGLNFEWKRRTGLRIVNNLGRVVKGAGAGALIGGAILQHPYFSAAGAFVGGVGGMIHTEEGVATTPATASFDRNDDGIVTSAEREAALVPWNDLYSKTADMWKKETGTLYRLPKFSTSAGVATQTASETSATARASEIDIASRAKVVRAQLDDATQQKTEQLVAGLQSQDKFASRILALGPAIVEEGWIERAVRRYGRFLEIARDNPGQIVVPTLDIDLIWHCHMLSPSDYVEDCKRIVGRVLPHDTGHSQETLGNAFQETQELWQQAHREPMVAPAGTLPPRKDPLERVYGAGNVARARQKKRRRQRREDNARGSYGACGSCGFHLPHSSRGTARTAEAEQVAALDADEAKMGWSDDSINLDNWWETPSIRLSISGFDSGGGGGDDCGGCGGD